MVVVGGDGKCDALAVLSIVLQAGGYVRDKGEWLQSQLTCFVLL